MSKYAVTPMYKSSTARYNAPTFFVEDKEEVKNCALSRFPEWHFNIIEVSKIKKTINVVAQKKQKDPNSKSQKGKLKTGHSDSRPVRRGLRRLAHAQGGINDGGRKAGAIKMW